MSRRLTQKEAGAYYTVMAVFPQAVDTIDKHGGSAPIRSTSVRDFGDFRRPPPDRSLTCEPGGKENVQ